jgi:hypothetical protein
MPYDNPLPGVPDVESPFFEELLAEKRLDPQTERIARDIRKSGYARFDFPLDDFPTFAGELLAELAGSYQGRIQDAWRTNAKVRRIAVDARILQILEGVYGRQPIPFQTLNFDRGTQQTFHSDIVHFSSYPERFMCGVWTALEDIDETQGPLRYIPGSHRWPTYTNEHVGLLATDLEYLENYPAYERMWQRLIDVHKGKVETLTGRCGTTLIWASNLLHGGSPQTDPSRTRHSQVTHYYFENCAYYTPLNSDPAYGSTFFRDITDVRTGETVPNMCCGQPISRQHLDRSLDYGIRRHGGLGLHKFLGA